MGEVTLLMTRAREGDRGAFDRMFELLYSELRALARRRLTRHIRDGSFDTRLPVKECCLKFAPRKVLTPGDRGHFLACSATVMRSVIVDAARAARTEIRSGDVPHVTLDTSVGDSMPEAADELLDEDEALRALAVAEPLLASIVQMRYSGSLTDLEIAKSLGLSGRTVRRDWQKARPLLARALRRRG